MYRLTIHQTGPDTVRITHKPTGFTYFRNAATQRDLVWGLKNTIRDLIYYHHGNDWHRVEARNFSSIKRSIISAVRRMR